MIRVPNSMCILGCVCLCFLDNVVCVHTHANILIESLQMCCLSFKEWLTLPRGGGYLVYEGEVLVEKTPSPAESNSWKWYPVSCLVARLRTEKYKSKLPPPWGVQALFKAQLATLHLFISFATCCLLKWNPRFGVSPDDSALNCKMSFIKGICNDVQHDATRCNVRKMHRHATQLVPTKPSLFILFLCKDICTKCTSIL